MEEYQILAKNIKNGRIVIKDNIKDIEKIIVKDNDGNFVVFNTENYIRIKYKHFKANIELKSWKKDLNGKNNMREQIDDNILAISALIVYVSGCEDIEKCHYSAADIIRKFASLVSKTISIYTN